MLLSMSETFSNFYGEFIETAMICNNNILIDAATTERLDRNNFIVINITHFLCITILCICNVWVFISLVFIGFVRLVQLDYFGRADEDF